MTEQEHVVSLMRNTASVVGQQQLGEATSQIQYDSKGHALVIGEVEGALQYASALKANGMTIVHIDPQINHMKKRLTDDGVAVFTVPELSLSGYLGAYKAVVPAQGASDTDFDLGVSVFLETGCFDVVLDLSQQPVIPVFLPPFGYKHAATEEQAQLAVQELVQLEGEFEKPRYFNYNQSICAHSRSKISGCTSCIDVCAAGAITSNGEGVSVDPFLCQGCGSCSTVCPSGAMSYAYPRPANAIERTRTKLLDRSNACVVLLYSEAQAELIEAASLDTDILTLEVEEVSAFGADYWLSMLAGKACRIVLLSDARKDDPSRLAMTGQIALLNELLLGLGVDEETVAIVDSNAFTDGGVLPGSALDPVTWQSSVLNSLQPADFATHNDKRQTLRLALDALSEQLTPVNAVASLNSGAPFGRVNVDKQACTLCMSCVSSCPAKALLDGQDTPALRFVEANCLQCGLCEAACPESAITLEPQYTWDSISARQINTLHDQEPFHCLVCHTPFTTRAMIDAMSAKLSGHWMFEDPKAIRRLKLCGDCRVKDIFKDNQEGINVHQNT
ncbi:MAG: 4Fe-4S binding protein [Granulosicoccus sp.]